MVHQDIPFPAIHLQTTQQVKAVRIDLARPYSFESIYVPPHNFNIDGVEDLLGQLPHPSLLLGDFIRRHRLWGDTLCNPRGRALVSLVSRVDALFLSDDTPTQFQRRTGHSPVMTCQLVHLVHNQISFGRSGKTNGNDHFPMLLEAF